MTKIGGKECGTRERHIVTIERRQKLNGTATMMTQMTRSQLFIWKIKVGDGCRSIRGGCLEIGIKAGEEHYIGQQPR